MDVGYRVYTMMAAARLVGSVVLLLAGSVPPLAADRQTDRQTGRQPGSQAGRQAARQAARQAGSQAGSQNLGLGEANRARFTQVYQV